MTENGENTGIDRRTDAPRRRRSNTVKTLDALEEIRLDNLKVLTEKPGTKIRFGQIVGLSASNVSHRLHRIKVIDAEESRFYAERLGLPPDWFEARRTPHEVPRRVLQFLTSRTPVPMAPPRPRRARVEATGEERPKRPRGRPVGSTKPVPHPVTPTPTEAPANDPLEATGIPAGYDFLEDIGEVQPIARELLKMVAIKSRQGKLDEMTALRLLGEVGQL